MGVTLCEQTFDIKDPDRQNVQEVPRSEGKAGPQLVVVTGRRNRHAPDNSSRSDRRCRGRHPLEPARDRRAARGLARRRRAPGRSHRTRTAPTSRPRCSRSCCSSPRSSPTSSRTRSSPAARARPSTASRSGCSAACRSSAPKPRTRTTSSASRSPARPRRIALGVIFGVLAFAFDAFVAPRHVAADGRRVARARERRARRLQPAARRAARRRPRAHRDAAGSATAIAGTRRSPRRRPGRVVGTLLVVGSLAAAVRGPRLLHHRARRLLRARARRARKRAPRACCARSTTAPSAS